MQCPHCNSFLPPGASDCWQCGYRAGQQRTAPADVNVHPPRASQLAKRLRKIVYAYRLESFATKLLEKTTLQMAQHGYAVNMVLSVIPGLGHWRSGRSRLARLYFATFIGLLLLAVLLWGYALAQLIVAAMIFLHLYCILDNARAQFAVQPILNRLIWSAIIGFALLLCVYLPMDWLRRSLVNDIIVTYDTHSTLVAQGEMLLINPRIDPDKLRRGDIVLLEIKGEYFREFGYLEQFYLPNSQVLDRVLALSGDTIAFKPDGIWVNDQQLSPEQYPINAQTLPDTGTWVVPPRCCFIYLSGLDFKNIASNLSQKLRLQRSLVAFQQIRGRAFMVYTPIGKRRFL